MKHLQPTVYNHEVFVAQFLAFLRTKRIDHCEGFIKSVSESTTASEFWRAALGYRKDIAERIGYVDDDCTECEHKENKIERLEGEMKELKEKYHPRHESNDSMYFKMKLEAFLENSWRFDFTEVINFFNSKSDGRTAA